MRWTPTLMDQLERAARQGGRVVFTRRGTEFTAVARRVFHAEGRDHLVVRLPMTGEELSFPLEDLESFMLLG